MNWFRRQSKASEGQEGQRAKANATELQEEEYIHSVWEIYRREWATASPEKRTELNKRMLRWQELMKNGWTASQAYYRVIQDESDYGVTEEGSDKIPSYSPWSWMRKAPFIVLGLALVASIVYGIVITGDRNALNTDLKSVQNRLTSIQTDLATTQTDLASTQWELSSAKQSLASTQADLSLTQADLSLTQTKLADKKQELTSTQWELSNVNDALASVQNELGTTKAKLETAEDKIKLYRETFGADVFVFSIDKHHIKKGGLGSPEVDLTDNPTARNPSWGHLIEFLLDDPTDDEYYSEALFNCTNFAEMLHDNAEADGIKAAFVGVQFRESDIGHALNAFRTTDKGLVYVDCTGDDLYLPTFWEWLYEQSHPTEWDKIAYVVKGKEYGLVSIDRAVSPKYSYYEQIGKSLSDWKSLGSVESIEIYW